MLRLPSFRYHRPRTLDEALGLLDTYGDDAVPVAGGTDLIPNMKHGLFTPGHLVSLGGLPELRGIGAAGPAEPAAGPAGRPMADPAAPAELGAAPAGRPAAQPAAGWLALGASETLSDVASDLQVGQRFTSLASAAGEVAGPQLRNRGTLGGNLCLDTRCTYYNQSAFWREALGYCLKKDGTVCHVTRVGQKCVAAHSADTPPVLMTLGAEVEIAGPDGLRRVPVEEFFIADGIWNLRKTRREIVTRILIPLDGGFRERCAGSAWETEARLVTGYGKLRQRNAIDFPLLSVAVAAVVDRGGTCLGLRGVVTALGARPRTLSGWEELAVGRKLDEPEVVEALAERAFAQCHPLENLIVDPEWRRAMVPVQLRRVLGAMMQTPAQAA